MNNDLAAPFLTEGTVFTRREQEVMPLVAQGLDNNAIADELHVSVGQVRSHISHITCKIADRIDISRRNSRVMISRVYQEINEETEKLEEAPKCGR